MDKMSSLRLGLGDLKLFLLLAFVFNVPPLLALVPFAGVFAVLPTMFWANIPGMPLTLLGIHRYEVQEFGVLPHGPVEVGLIVLFWCLVAVVATMIVKHRRAAVPASGRHV
jgi:hypothetical protein